MSLPPLVRALRPHQWAKNVFVLAAIGFAYGDETLGSGSFDSSSLVRTLVAFAAFCMGSSAIYLINDVKDVESDRAHPEKCKRPIAAGELSIPYAIAASIGCATLALSLAVIAGGGRFEVVAVVATYMVMNLAYSLRLKRIVLVDVFCIAAGFVFRVKAGGYAAGAEVSHWLLLCTFFLALFLALNKRRSEIVLLGDDRASHRKILRDYDVGFLDQMVTMLAAVTVLCYTMYTVDPATIQKFGSGRMVYTVPFVVFGVGRYMLLVQTNRGGGEPTKVLLGGDGLFVANALLWLAAAGLVVLT